MGAWPSNPSEVQEFIRKWPVHAKDKDDPNFKSPAAIEALQDELLVKQLDLVMQGSQYYQELFKREKIDPSTIRGIKDLRRALPITFKRDYMIDPDAFRLRLPNPGIYDTLYTVTYTSGSTTGKPSPFYNTSHDVFGSMFTTRIAFGISYLTPADRIMSAFPVAPIPHVGFLNIPFNVGALGASYSACYGGTPYPDFPVQCSTQEIIDRVELVKPTCVMGIGSYLRRLFKIARDQGRDFTSIRQVWPAGEALPGGMRADMRQTLEGMGAKDLFITNGLGLTEAQTQWVECSELGGLHNPNPGWIYLEVVHPETLEPVPDGEIGLMVITHLNRRGTVLLRYATGDLIAMERGYCPVCGRNGDRIVIKIGSTYASRTADLTKIKGELVNPEVLRDGVVQTPGVLEYQVIVTKEDPNDPYSMDKVVVRVYAEGRDRGEVRADVVDRVMHAVMVRPEVKFVDNPSEIYDPLVEFKAKRFFDQRPKER